MAHNKSENVLVYNEAFFKTSQTFMYHQAVSLQEKYGVILLAKKFVNPHGFNMDSFQRVQIRQPENIFDRILSKYVRSKYDTLLHVDFFSYLRLKRVLMGGNLKAIHAHFGPNALQLLPFAKKYSIPLVVTFHGFDASQALSDEEYSSRLPELFNYASAIIIVSNHMKETLKLEDWEHKVHVVPCSVNPDELPVRINHKKDTIRILHSGRLTGKKGVPDLIRVFKNLIKNHSDIELHIAGDGRELEICRKLVEESELETDVTFYGSVSHEKVKELMTTSDIFVLNSRVDEYGDMEGTPVSLLEAMSAKVPVVSTIHAGIPDVVEDGKNGLLVPEKDNPALEHALKTLIENPDLRDRYAEKARETIMEKYTVKHMQNKLEKTFETI